MTRRAPFFRVVRYTKSLESARNALRYAAFRSEDVQEKSPLIFDDRSDSADVKRFMRALDDPITRHPNAAKAYHCVLSLSRGAYDRLGDEGDWRAIVRDVVRTYELETHRRLSWVAVEHNSPTHSHPHVHLVLKATFRTSAGATRRLRIDRQGIAQFRDITGRVLSARGLSMDRGAPRFERSQRPPAFRPLDRAGFHWGQAVGTGLAWLQQQIKTERLRRQEEEREELERERRRREEERDR